MSKETTLILLGLFIMALRTVLGLPGTWQTVALVISGGAVAIIGFLLRGEALSRGARHHRNNSFVETQPEPQEHAHSHDAHTHHAHDHKEGITSLN